MTIYIILLLVIGASVLVDHSNVGLSNPEKRSNWLLMTLFLFIFLILALRASSVGRDLPGYERVYGWTGIYAWDDYDYVYFEKGYVFLMKICFALGLNFQWFLAVVSAVTLYPIYLFIRRYSTDKCLSCLIYVSYMFFEFDMTGIRQAIAMSIALLAFMCLMEEKRGYLVKFLALVWMASLFHKSALICLLILPIRAIKDLKIVTIVIAVGTIMSLALRSVIFQYIKSVFDKDTFNLSAGMYIGSNIFFMVILSAFFFVTLNIQGKSYTLITEKGKEWLSHNELLYKLFLSGLMTAVFFGSETSARSFMYFAQSIIVLMPNAAVSLKRSSVVLFKMSFIVFFFWFFYTNSLSGGGFDIVPYKFFWN